MKEILKDIYTWAWYSEMKGFDFNGWLIRTSDATVMVDPPIMTGDELARIDELGSPKHIIVTNRDHDREVADYRERFGAETWMHKLDAPLVDIRIDHTFEHGNVLPGDLEVIHIQDNKSPGESALLLHRIPNVLILGDALIGNPPGKLTLLPPDKYAEVSKAREGIRILLDYEFSPILTSDGSSILENGRAAIDFFLSDP